MPAQTTAYTPSSFPSPAPSRPPLSHPQRCEYTSKRCENVRALKPNGERHRLCDYHRQLANNNQRRWQNRKKMLQQQNEQSVRGMGQPIPLTSEQFGHIYHQHELPPRYSTVSLPAQALAPPPQAHEEPLVLPPLRQHHVLSHALSLPVSPHLDIATGADEGLEFGGVPRGMAVSLPVPQLRDSYHSFEHEHSASDPARFDGGAWARHISDPTSHARSVSKCDF